MFGNKTMVVLVEGMHCGHCAARVEKALSALSGVKGAKVDLASKKATIKYKGEFIIRKEGKRAAAGGKK